ncbi:MULTISPECIES: type III-B CRISPR module-associated protein Cmr3 [unclassified Meiothermus]|uniref:type III-B CRISPR module-associated protein Cmr3 n=1 Tax=unclassified Meiothermus TaxID=370471 RepID=UPI000D7C8558|nr:MULTISPECIES: type III-B CRISPR module-associated protein Cmr3 [unclassified Meiothermus]PZA07711.1 type III-B CRISPR module-associated protein Cmr3 [Meiothermus sp. Pnk-1]RYM34475.1 type III-B CRISPR module-associated protein Cmr3 [Meiothermus sp. PNK-Is4]
MPERVLEIHALSPLLFRDGRPFSAADGTETAAQSLPLPLPSTLAGFVRTQVGLAAGMGFSHQELQNLHGLQVCGPLLARGGEILLPAPRDAVIYKEGEKPQLMKLRPFSPPEGAGCDLPGGLLPLEVTQDVKPESGYNFWTAGEMERWLLDEEVLPAEKISGLPSETRVHVAMDPAKGKAREGQLFSVAYRPLETGKGPEDYRPASLRVRLSLSNGWTPARIGYLGGERRPVAVEVKEGLSEYWYDCPEGLKKRFAGLGKGARVRLVLATPALFEGGWRPGWVEKSGTGELHLPRGLSKVRLRLVAAAVGRREPVSGWSLRAKQPKAVRWMVPAGSVYFFEVLEGNPADLLESWLRPVSDDEQDRKDGFGLALWGVW